MRRFTGRVREIRLDANGRREVCISCPAGAIPTAGQYLMASDPAEATTILDIPLYNTEKTQWGFWAVPLYPAAWEPGISLNLVGPLGRGFNLPRNLQRLGLVALGETIARLKPLVASMADAQAGVTLYTDLTLPRLPAALEVFPLASLNEALDWADFIALDVPMAQLSDVRPLFGIPEGISLPCPAQVLITVSMPCAGMAKCGACAVRAHRGWKLVCENGPVFDLNELKW